MNSPGMSACAVIALLSDFNLRKPANPLTKEGCATCAALLLSSPNILRGPHRGMYRAAFPVCARLEAVNASVPARASQPVRQPGETVVIMSILVRQHAVYQYVTPYGFHQKLGLYSRNGVVHRRPVPGVRQAAYQRGNGAHWILLRPRGLRSLQSWNRLRTIRMRTGQFRRFSGFRRSIRRLRD